MQCHKSVKDKNMQIFLIAFISYHYLCQIICRDNRYIVPFYND